MATAEKRSISVSEFKAHCAEELREVEDGSTELEITRHGKVIARVSPPHEADGGFVRDVIGSGAGLVIVSGDAALDELTWKSEDWEDFPEDEEDANAAGSVG